MQNKLPPGTEAFENKFIYSLIKENIRYLIIYIDLHKIEHIHKRNHFSQCMLKIQWYPRFSRICDMDSIKITFTLLKFYYSIVEKIACLVVQIVFVKYAIRKWQNMPFENKAKRTRCTQSKIHHRLKYIPANAIYVRRYST